MVYFRYFGQEQKYQAAMIRTPYNVIQWAHRATRGWSYGRSVVDPRAGEILLHRYQLDAADTLIGGVSYE